MAIFISEFKASLPSTQSLQLLLHFVNSVLPTIDCFAYLRLVVANSICCTWVLLSFSPGFQVFLKQAQTQEQQFF
ncbi:hypothetical protein GC194_12300 [bacterium]|nr:hypothetical protein [bacterium]